MSKNPKQHYISRFLIKRWADHAGKVGVVCLHHRGSATVSAEALHWVRDLSSPQQESKWDARENRASLVIDDLTASLGPRTDNLAAAEAFLTEPTKLKALIDLAVLHRARSLTVPLQQIMDGHKAADSAAAEATIQQRWAEAQSYHQCGLVVSVLPADAPVPLGAVPAFNTSDWGGEDLGTSALYLMPLTPRVVIAGNPDMRPGQVSVIAESPETPSLLLWQIAGEVEQFSTPYLICQPSALRKTAAEALDGTVGTAMHWHALRGRVDLYGGTVDMRQTAEWRRCVQRNEHRQGLHTDPTTTDSMRSKYRRAMIKDARELQASLDEHGIPICACSGLNHGNTPEVAALWRRFMPQIICDAMHQQ